MTVCTRGVCEYVRHGSRDGLPPIKSINAAVAARAHALYPHMCVLVPPRLVGRFPHTYIHSRLLPVRAGSDVVVCCEVCSFFHSRRPAVLAARLSCSV